MVVNWLALVPLLWIASQLVRLVIVRPDLGSALLTLGAHTLACLAVGSGALRLFGIRAPWSGVSLAGALGSAWALGQGLLGALWQELAALGVFTPAMVGAVTLTCAVPGARLTRELLAAAWPRARSVLRELVDEAPAWRIVAGSLLALSLWALLLTAHHPRDDALAFYLSQPKLIAESHRLVPLPGYGYFARIGLGSEMNFAFGYLFQGELAAKMTAWTALLSLVLLLTGLSARAGLGTRGKLIVVAMLYSSTAIVNLVFDGKSDLFAAALAVAAVHWALEPGASTAVRFLPLAGLFAGLAISGKLRYSFVLPTLLAVVSGWRILTRVDVVSAPATTRALALLRGGAQGVLWTSLGLLPIALKNWLVFDDPLAVYDLRTHFDTPWYTPEDMSWIVRTYPLALVLGDYPMQGGTMSPLLLAFAPLGLLRLGRDARPRPELVVLTLASVSAVVGWLVVGPSVIATRFLFPPLLVVFLFAARSAEQAAAGPGRPWLRTLVPWSVLTTLALSVSGYRAVHAEALRPPAEWENFNGIIGRALRDRLPPDARWMLACFESYGIDAAHLQCALTTDEVPLVYGAEPGQSMWIELHDLGARALVVNEVTHVRPAGATFSSMPEARSAPPWLKVTELTLTETITLFLLQPDPDAPPPRAWCVQERPGVWTVRRR